MPPPNTTSTPIYEAIEAVTKLDSHVYKVHLADEFCLGKGEYSLTCPGKPKSIFSNLKHNTSSAQRRLCSIMHARRRHHGSTDLPRGASYWRILPTRTCRPIGGISLPTDYEGRPDAALPDLPDFDALKDASGTDGVREEPQIPSSAAKFVRSLQNWRFYLPRQEPLVPGVLDMWIRLASGGNITQGMIPYIADSFPFNMHTFLAAPELRRLLLAKPSETDDSRKGQQKELKERNEERASLWFPTLVMNLEVKSPLPKEGTERLAVRITSKQIKDGRFDLDILIRDTEGEIITLSHHVAMILSVERNAGRDDSSTKASL